MTWLSLSPGEKYQAMGTILSVFPLPLFIEIGKQAQDDSFTAFGVLEIAHNTLSIK
jgi:hypothetical protein